MPVDPGLERTGPASGADVLAHQRVLRVHGHITDVPGFRVAGHLEHERVVRVQHRAVGGDFHDDAFQFGELFERIDALETQMVGLHVQYGADVDFPDTHARAQQAAARGFEHGDVDLRVCQYHARGNRPRHVALHGTLAVDVDSIRGGQARCVAAHFCDMREHSRRRRLAVGAGDCRNRHARGRACREQHGDDRRGDVAGRAFARRDVHAKTGRRVHFADAAADGAVALGNVLGEKIHAAHVQPDGAHGALRHLAVIGMYDVGDVRRRAARG